MFIFTFAIKKNLIDMLKGILLPFILLFSISPLFAQYQTVGSAHNLLGVDVEGYEVDLPFSKEKAQNSWKEYAKDFGRSEDTQNHKTYQTTFRTDIYVEEVLIFSQITGNTEKSVLWMGIDPQGIPKEIYPELQKAVEEFVYNFNLKMRTDLAQKKIDESEQAATYLSKEFEDLKRDERKNQKNYERTNEKILEYEQELEELRNDSTQYVQTLENLKNSIDSLYSEIEKVKSVVEVYKEKLKEIN